MWKFMSLRRIRQALTDPSVVGTRLLFQAKAQQLSVLKKKKKTCQTYGRDFFVRACVEGILHKVADWTHVSNTTTRIAAAAASGRCEHTHALQHSKLTARNDSPPRIFEVIHEFI